MRIITANHSSYPRVGEGKQAQRIRRAYAQRERGRIDDAGFGDIVQDYITEIIGEQEAAGLGVVTDGQVHWYDCIAHPAGNLDGTEIRGLLRWFDTNTYIRQPEITGTIGGRFQLSDDFAFAKGVATTDVKAVVTGPYTLARHTIGANGNVAKLTASYAEALAAELGELANAGATLVQIDEPSLLRHPDDIGVVANALETAAAAKGDLALSLTTFFGDATALYPELLDLPVDMLGLDLVYGPGLVDAIVATPPAKRLALGAIDGRNTKLDDVEAVKATVSKVADAVDTDELHLQPSCGLEYLPRDRAQRKLARLCEIAGALV